MRYALVVLLLAGCASGPGIKESWYPDDASWQSARREGARLNYHDGAPSKFIPPEKIDSLVTAKERLERVSGVKADLALMETDAPNAFALTRYGRPVIAISLSYLDALYPDRDALATTVGHELAHLHLGHTGPARAEREKTVAAGQVAGQIMDLVIPFSGTLASLGITAYQRSFSRDEERAADAQGLQWAIEAGYDPCGLSRMLGALQSVSVAFLSSHPSYEERAELVNEYAIKATGKPCP
jgi:Zn-dependent protease with chaperone function